MKLRNKKTGEIVDVESLGHADSLKGKFGYQVTLSWKIDEHLDTCKTYNSLAELNEEWEDYEEPKEYYYLNEYLELDHEMWTDTEFDNKLKALGNYFDTKEEAEKAVEKLKAWHKLMDYWGTEVLGWEIKDMPTGGNWQTVNVKFNVKTRKEPMELLNILFGGEE